MGSGRHWNVNYAGTQSFYYNILFISSKNFNTFIKPCNFQSVQTTIIKLNFVTLKFINVQKLWKQILIMSIDLASFWKVLEAF